MKMHNLIKDNLGKKEKINFILQVANKISKLFIPVKYADKILVVLENPVQNVEREHISET